MFFVQDSWLQPYQRHITPLVFKLLRSVRSEFRSAVEVATKNLGKREELTERSEDELNSTWASMVKR